MARFAVRCAPAVIALLVAVTGCTVARTAARQPASVSTPARETLANGVQVVVQEHRGSDVTALQLWVRAGGRDEGAGELGLAHYLEHMLFKGTVSRPTGFIDRDVEGVGGRMNAGTSLDYTYYHMVLPATRTAAAIELLADISVNASLESGVLDAEKRVVLEEMRLSEDNPRRFLSRRLMETLFEGHPYGRPVIGTPDLVRGLTRETLLAFYRRLYVPEALTLVVVGPVRPAEVLEHAHKTLGRIPRSGSPPLPIVAPAPVRARHVEITRPGTHAYFGLAWQGPRIDHADVAAVDLLVAILGETRTSRLTRVLRDEQGLVSSISSGYAALEGAGAVNVTAQTDPANVERAVAEVLVQIRRLRDEGVTEIERRRAITSAEAYREFRKETAEGRAQALGHAATVWRIEDELAYLDRVRTVTAAQIQAAARKYLDPDRYVRITFLPPR
jgi:zinc protease